MDALQASVSIQDRHAFRRLVLLRLMKFVPRQWLNLSRIEERNLSHSEGIRETTRTILRSTLYNPAMNKRARKRLKEAIEKKNLERQKMLKEQSSASSQTKERRGFTVKPEKKRG